MGEPRIFVKADQIEEDRLRFSPEDLRHLRRVLRLREGETLRATDGSGLELLARLESEGGELRGRIVERRRPVRESPLAVCLVQALPKKDLMEQVLQKAVELGVSEVQPVVTRRTVAVMKGGRSHTKLLRWQRIIEGAVAQSGRTVLPRLREVLPWAQFLDHCPEADLKLLLKEHETGTLERVVRARPRVRSVVLAVGPEGGWEEREVDAAVRSGFEITGLGPRVLRTETAGAAALCLLQFLCGDLGEGGLSGPTGG